MSGGALCARPGCGHAATQHPHNPLGVLDPCAVAGCACECFAAVDTKLPCPACGSPMNANDVAGRYVCPLEAEPDHGAVNYEAAVRGHPIVKRLYPLACGRCDARFDTWPELYAHLVEHAAHAPGATCSNPTHVQPCSFHGCKARLPSTEGLPPSHALQGATKRVEEALNAVARCAQQLVDCELDGDEEAIDTLTSAAGESVAIVSAALLDELHRACAEWAKATADLAVQS